jgi:hypothetical protein
MFKLTPAEVRAELVNMRDEIGPDDEALDPTLELIKRDDENRKLLLDCSHSMMLETTAKLLVNKLVESERPTEIMKHAFNVMFTLGFATAYNAARHKADTEALEKLHDQDPS